ncbi:alpha/beta fold hydrolase [Aurantibacillus circumpalustris]|uniref:alpha/beta fold hydrolase n=1 Tax=Aurantibacillus circumpalustris TaxID=3036359 RepID=UPI00295B2B8E|nr:alpha/beta hydrolase [Aurantibacillus circumpalustris]
MICKTKDNQNLYYKIQGNIDSNETIVFLNGLTQSTDSWILMTPFFKEKYKIVLLDFIFQGQSDKDGKWRDFDTHAQDFKTVLDLEKLAHVNIVGISYGSLVAQHFAVAYPGYVKKLVLISTFANKTPYYEAIELSWWRALEVGGYNLMLDIMLPSVLSENYFSNPLVSISNLKNVRKDSDLSSESIFNLMRATKERKDFRKDLKRIQAETLVIQGERDMLFPVHLAEEVQQNIKHSKLIVIKNAGHTLNLEHVSEVSACINEFLD